MRIASIARFVAVVLALAALALPSCAPNEAAAQRPYTVQGGFIRDVDGRAVIMRGVNISGAHKLPPFFDFHQAADYAQVRDDWGLNAVRFLVSWAALEPEPGNYDEQYIGQIKERMQWAKDAGLLVVIDMHQDLYGLGFTVNGYTIGNGAPAWTCDASHYAAFADAYDPSTDWFLDYLNPDMAACYDQFWQSDDLWSHYANAVAHLGKALADNDNVIGVDLMNEPNWGTAEMAKFESQDLQYFYERIIPTIREASPRWLMF
ncbi:MAG TPA: cellulase family glycosylhydrolase, partial [Myxococcota bacterium]